LEHALPDGYKFADKAQIDRGKGLAAAALFEMYRRMKPLGATFMTGGSGEFYKKLGFKPYVTWTEWEKCKN